MPSAPRRLRSGAAELELDEEEAAGWSVIETREGSDEAGGPSERALPAVMRCFDRAKICLKAGDGGAGATAFRREAHVDHGGPSGGNGGDGGSIWLVGDAALNSLLPFRKAVHFTAGDGLNGTGKNCYGAAGQPSAGVCISRLRRRPCGRRRDYQGAAGHAGEGR